MAEMDIKKFYDEYAQTSDIKTLNNLDRQYCAYLEERLKKNPKDIEALVHLGMLNWEPFHQDEKTEKYLLQAIEYDPKNVDARFWLASSRYWDRCNYAGARELIEEGLQINPYRADLLSLLASIISDTTEYFDQEFDCIKKAVEYAPDWPGLRLELADFYLRVGEIALAENQVQQFEKLILLSPLKPRNGIEDHYESMVTGRNHVCCMNSFQRIKERIERAKHSS